MANPNIDLLGAVYPTVAGVTLPTQGGGTATFPWVEGSQTITQNGTYDVSALAEAVVNVSGGGGANIVTGTFKGTTTGAAIDVTLNYTGSGYPVVVVIYPKEGPYNNTTGSWYSLIQRYSIATWCGIKTNTGSTPTYSSSSYTDSDLMMVSARYKSSTSSEISYANQSSNNAATFQDANAIANSLSCVKIRSNKKMSVFIASTSWGFAANIEYTYQVIYSS